MTIQADQQVILNLTVSDVQNLLIILGDMPTKTGVYPLVMKIKSEAETYLASQEEV